MVIEEAIFEKAGDKADRIMEVWNRVNSNKLNPSGEDLQYLLETYNEFIDKYPNNTKCGDCRRIIFNSWKNIIKVWLTLKK